MPTGAKKRIELSMGDRLFFEDFLDDYQEFIFYTVCGKLSNPPEQEDLMQDVLIRLMKQIPSLRDIRDSKGKTAYYIRETVDSCFSRNYRRKRSCQEIPMDQETMERHPSAYQQSISIYEATYSTWDVRLLQMQLSEQEWKLLSGYYRAGYTGRELAKYCGCKPGGIYMALHRAREKARKILGIGSERDGR